MPDMRSALSSAFQSKGLTAPKATYTPESPDPHAVKRVRNPIPAPTVCPYCGSAVKVVGHKQLYGKSYGPWPYAYACEKRSCNSYVGMHPFTNIPLGTIANYELREARQNCKTPFNLLWDDKEPIMTRSQAYAFLAKEMGLTPEQCHFGWFTLEQCSQASDICARKYVAEGKDEAWRLILQDLETD